MYLDKDTKLFLLHVLNENSPSGSNMGGGAGGGNAEWSPGSTMPNWANRVVNDQSTALPTLKNNADSNILNNPLVALSTVGFDTEKQKGESEDDFQKRLGGKVSKDFKNVLKYVSDIDFDQMPKDRPSLEYLAALGTVKRSLGYPTSADSGSELMDFGPAKDKSGDIDIKKTLFKPAGRLVSLGLSRAALNTGMGELGKKLSGKMNYLAALGVDPFDYATKVMGVDYTADQLAKLPKRQKQQITAGQGYIGL